MAIDSSSPAAPSTFRKILALLRYRVLRPGMNNARLTYRGMRNWDRIFEPVFIAGAMGSGTSLTALMMAQHLDAAGVVTESARQISRKSFLWADRTENYPSIEAYESAIAPSTAWSTAEATRSMMRMYRSHAVRPGRVIIDKGPNTNLSRAPFLRACFPSAPFVLVFRDPVANIEGFRRKWSSFRNDSLEENIRFYRALHENFLDFCDESGASLTVVEYEHFVEEPDRVLQQLSERLALRRSTHTIRMQNRPDSSTRGIRSVRDNRIQIVKGATHDALGNVSDEETRRIRGELDELHARLQKRARSSTL